MKDGLWVKCSLHSHSTVSDGMLNPEEVVEYYTSNGYKVVSITDHGKLAKPKVDGVCYLLGVEVSCGKSILGEPYHIICLGLEEFPISKTVDPQEAIDSTNEAGGVAFLAHPYWSNLTYEDIVRLEGYIGIEVYNAGCEVEVGKGYSSVYWDNLLSRGSKIFGLAVDDAHRYTVPPLDALKGWIYTKMRRESYDEILDNLREGLFYSTMGPKIHRFEYSNSLIEVEATPASKVSLISSNGKGLTVSLETVKEILKLWKEPSGRGKLETMFYDVDFKEEEGRSIVALEGRYGWFNIKLSNLGIEKLEWRQKSRYSYLRLEVTDRLNRKAWSNPIFI